MSYQRIPQGTQLRSLLVYQNARRVCALETSCSTTAQLSLSHVRQPHPFSQKMQNVCIFRYDCSTESFERINYWGNLVKKCVVSFQVCLPKIWLMTELSIFVNRFLSKNRGFFHLSTSRGITVTVPSTSSWCRAFGFRLYICIKHKERSNSFNINRHTLSRRRIHSPKQIAKRELARFPTPALENLAGSKPEQMHFYPISSSAV